MSRSRLKNDPLDGLISTGSLEGNGSSVPANSKTEDKLVLKSEKIKKQRVTVLMDPEVADRVRDAVYWTPGETLASFIEKATEEAILKAEKRRGESFPKRKGNLPLGRPVQ